jgi:hypothetical protein
MSEITSIYQKILAVQKLADSVPKRGYNNFHKYHYATEADILEIKKLLNEQGLIVVPSTESQETGFKPDGKSWARVSLRFRVINTEQPDEQVDALFSGYAEDSFDKAIYKATTGAHKYFYLKFFGVATEDDPEREEAQQQQSQQKQQKGGYQNPQKKRQQGQQKNMALVHANKILSLQKQYQLSNEDVLFYGEIDSIKDLANQGQAEVLAQAYLKLQNHVRVKAG